MNPDQFVSKWSAAELRERQASQEQFIDLCRMLGEPTPSEADPRGEWYCFEAGATKTTGRNGWADIWKRGFFAWEYKGKHRDLNAAYSQLQQYAPALANPPLLVVSDMVRFRIHTNWTNLVSEVHEIALPEILDRSYRDLLRSVFTEPDRLKPGQTRQALTEKAAGRFAELAKRLRARGYDPVKVAHFVNRLVFCMFAEDVDLLPKKMFRRMLDVAIAAPSQFQALAAQLFGTMRTGGLVGFESIAWFNGGLFDDADALPLEGADIKELIQAADLDWSDIDPSIFGTLFERGLDPDNQSALGAFYTDRDKIMLIVEPVILRPLQQEWDGVKAGIAEQGAIAAQTMETIQEQQRHIEDYQEAVEAVAGTQKSAQPALFGDLGRQRRVRSTDQAKASIAKAMKQKKAANDEAQRLLNEFLARLWSFRVLDPACGSGNFLYLALYSLKDFEHRVLLEAEALGFERPVPSIGPEAVLGIEINPYAAELARISVWIGEIQWMLQNGFEVGRNPILKPLNTIECRDALISPTGDIATWPRADVVIGNPPFLGAKWMKSTLGEDYTQLLRKAYCKIAPNSTDFVGYWFARCGELIADGHLLRAGLVATNNIRGAFNRQVMQELSEKCTIFEAWADEPWVLDGAAIRVSVVCFAKENCQPDLIRLDGQNVLHINTNLSSAKADVTKALCLKMNQNISFTGIQKGGNFDIPGSLAREWLSLPKNPNGQSNSDVLFPMAVVPDIVKRHVDKWIIDFRGLSEADAMLYEAPFKYIENEVKNKRAENREERTSSKWWLHRRSGADVRKAISGLPRYIATPLVSKHRVFTFVSSTSIPDIRIVVISSARNDIFGVLQSRIHEIWSLSICSKHGVGNDPVYTPSTIFETFPFPDGMLPDAQSGKDTGDLIEPHIAAAATRLHELRENWLNPSDLVRREPVTLPPCSASHSA
ncbi:type II restriction/modification system DNA methylase subunit YeeA [Skermanella aerolata]|uniref:class I SAM-dependent DNA methyltransferase n=1 Tax=Skermanella aerolata TaxID=393310 RepID=UPI003D1E428B